MICRFCRKSVIGFYCGNCKNKKIQGECIPCHSRKVHKGAFLKLMEQCRFCGGFVPRINRVQAQIFYWFYIMALPVEVVATILQGRADGRKAQYTACDVQRINDEIIHICPHCQERIYPPVEDLRILSLMGNGKRKAKLDIAEHFNITPGKLDKILKRCEEVYGFTPTALAALSIDGRYGRNALHRVGKRRRLYFTGKSQAYQETPDFAGQQLPARPTNPQGGHFDSEDEDLRGLDEMLDTAETKGKNL